METAVKEMTAKKEVLNGTAKKAVQPQPIGGKQDLGDGDWVLLPSRISHGQMKLIRRFGIQAAKEGDDRDLMIQTNTVLLMVKEWNLKDEDGVVCPISEAGIDSTDQAKITKIFDEIGRMIEAAFPNQPSPEPPKE